jgi:hypothetical protein
MASMMDALALVAAWGNAIARAGGFIRSRMSRILVEQSLSSFAFYDPAG